MADGNIRTLTIANSGINIFSTDKYIIPLYQRAFAWEDKEIEQMIDDILNFETDNYYLGNLIVYARKDGKFEVIDGQQRLTALYLLLTALNIDFEGDAVSFEYRQKSDEDNIRFESFLTFRHFLLHVLRIFELEEAGGEFSSHKDWGGELIDDKKLIQRFETAFTRKQTTSKCIERFGMCLLRCRFLFDNYMLKREFNGDDTEGKWSLKLLKVSWSNSKKYAKRQPKAYYVDVPCVDKSRMLQSMLRVTYTSPLVMHWVTDYLSWLYFNEYEYNPIDATEKLECIAKVPVRNYVDNAKKANFRDGIEGQSLKLQRMADATGDADAWIEDTAIAHGEEMLEILQQALSN